MSLNKAYLPRDESDIEEPFTEAPIPPESQYHAQANRIWHESNGLYGWPPSQNQSTSLKERGRAGVCWICGATFVKPNSNARYCDKCRVMDESTRRTKREIEAKKVDDV